MQALVIATGFGNCYRTKARHGTGPENMTRYMQILTLLAVLLPTGVAAQHMGSPQQQRACRSDVLRHCRAMQDKDDITIAFCLKANIKKLTPACRQVIEDSPL